MNKSRWFPLLACLAFVLSLAGCHNSGQGQNTTNLRVLHAVLDAEPLDVLVNGSVKAPAVALNSASQYSNFGSGTQDTQIRSTQGGAILLDKSIVYAPDVS